MTRWSRSFLILGGCSVAALMLGSCSWMHRNRVSSCRETTLVTEARNLPPLKVPPGLDAPDTRNAIKVPELNEPERPRGPHEPCLSQPPSYKG
jgi:uncharacterized lipoprotein